MSDGPCAVFMGNLNDECTKSEVCSMIVYVFNDVLGISIKKENVNISISYHSKCFTATVFVPNEIYQKLAVENLNQNMVPTGLIKKGRKLRIDYFRAGHEKENLGELLGYRLSQDCQNGDRIRVINYRKRMRRKRRNTDKQLHTGQGKQVSIHCARITQDHYSSNLSEDESTQRINNDVFSNKTNILEAEVISDDLDKVDYLTKHQQLGNENRTLEFKRGGGDYLKTNLRAHVGKYISGFLNSSGGTLLIGVDDDGFVQGVCLDRKEMDKIRVAIDEVVSRIEPAVTPSSYTVAFIPVKDNTNNLYVLKIAVGAGKTKMLYSNPNGDVFIRRDGSIQGPLKGKDLQQMYHMKIEEDFERKEADLKKQIKILESQLEDASIGQESNGSEQSRSSKSVVCTII